MTPLHFSRLLSLILLFTFVDIGSAQADPASLQPMLDPWTRVLSIHTQAGLGTPLGFAGGAVELTPLPYVTAEVGAGAGGDGAQAAMLGRLRILAGNNAIAFGGGISGGRYTTDDGGFGFGSGEWNSWKWSLALWANVEVSYEHRWDSGFTLRAFSGLATMINSSANTCTRRHGKGFDLFGESGSLAPDAPCSPENASALVRPVLPYVGLSLGYAFALGARSRK